MPRVLPPPDTVEDHGRGQERGEAADGHQAELNAQREAIPEEGDHLVGSRGPHP